MAYHVVGLDIGTRTVRAVILERTFRDFSITDVRQAPLTLTPEGEATPDATAAAISQVLAGLPTGQVAHVCAWPATMTSMWFFSLPFTDRKKLSSTVPFEVEDLVPFDLNDMLLEWRVLRTQEGRSDLMAALARRDHLRARLDQLSQMNLDPMALILDAHALAGALPESRGAPIAFVDIGHSRTLLGVARDGKVEHLQAIPRGGRDFTRALMERWSLPFADAEFLKHTGQLPAGWRRAPPTQAEVTALLSQEEEAAPPPSAAPGDWENETTPGPRPRASWDDFEAEVPTRVSGDPIAPSVSPDEEGKLDLAAEMLQSADETTDEIVLRAQQMEAELARKVIPADLNEATFTQALAPAMEALLQPLRAGLIAYETDKKREIAAVVLMGGGASLGGLPEHLQQELGVPVRKLARVGEAGAQLPTVMDPSPFALAFGLGLRGVTDGKRGEVNFRKEEFAWSQDSRRMELVILAAAAMVLLSLLAGAVYSAVSYQRLRAQLAELDAKIIEVATTALPDQADTLAAARAPDEAMAPLLESHLQYQERARTLGLIEHPPTAIELLLEVSETLSPGFPGSPDFVKVDVDEYTSSEGVIKLKGQTESFDATGKIESSLQKSELFTDVSMGEVTTARGSEEKKTFNLSITVKDATAEPDPS